MVDGQREEDLLEPRGHERGAEVIRDITKYCAELDTIETLTLYAF